MAVVREPVRERNISQFREGMRGRKVSPKPMYFHMGFGGGRGFAGLGMGIGFTAGAGTEGFWDMELEKYQRGDLEFYLSSYWSFGFGHSRDLSIPGFRTNVGQVPRRAGIGLERLVLDEDGVLKECHG